MTELKRIKNKAKTSRKKETGKGFLLDKSKKKEYRSPLMLGDSLYSRKPKSFHNWIGLGFVESGPNPQTLRIFNGGNKPGKKRLFIFPSLRKLPDYKDCRLDQISQVDCEKVRDHPAAAKRTEINITLKDGRSTNLKLKCGLNKAREIVEKITAAAAAAKQAKAKRSQKA